MSAPGRLNPSQGLINYCSEVTGVCHCHATLQYVTEPWPVTNFPRIWRRGRFSVGKLEGQA